jgi:predicted small secreted protein
MKDLIRDAVWATAVVLVVLIMSGCNTVRGLGTDIVNGTDASVQFMNDYSDSYEKQYGY